MNKKWYLIAGVCMIFASCDKQKVFEQYTPVQGKSWNSHDHMLFNVSITDTASPQNVYLLVRNTGQYEYSNLYLFVTTQGPGGNMVRDTVEIQLADTGGKWLGKGAATVYTLAYPYRTNVRFPDRGIYRFDIEQAMWIKELKHITHMGLRVEKASKKSR
jgi:gliding motility-associated lipoprotein GldH